MFSINSLPIAFAKSTPNKIKNIFLHSSQQQLALLQSKFIHLPIKNKEIPNVQQYFTEDTFPHIKEWKIQELRSSKKLFPLILFQISHINFQHLTFLHLTTCYIESIEAISWLDAPNLQQVSLQDNDVRSIKPLQKCNYKNLEFLSIHNNFFLHDQLKDLNRVRLSEEKAFHIKLGRSVGRKIPFIESLFKIEAGQKINASIGYTDFNSQKKFEQIKNRFPNSFMSMVEGEVWMEEQEEFLKEPEMESENEEESEYFPYLNI